MFVPQALGIMHDCLNFTIENCTVLVLYSSTSSMHLHALYLSTLVISVEVLVLQKLKSTWPNVCFQCHIIVTNAAQCL